MTERQYPYPGSESDREVFIRHAEAIYRSGNVTWNQAVERADSTLQDFVGEDDDDVFNAPLILHSLADVESVSTTEETPIVFDRERVKQLLGSDTLAKLAALALHGLSPEEARNEVQNFPLGTRTAMEQAGLITQTDIGNNQFEIALNPEFELALNVALEQ